MLHDFLCRGDKRSNEKRSDEKRSDEKHSGEKCSDDMLLYDKDDSGSQFDNAEIEFEFAEGWYLRHLENKSFRKYLGVC